MSAESINGIVIGYSDYRDHDRILTLLTAERGRIDCRSRNCRRPTAPLLACSQPFVYGEYTIFYTKAHGTLNSCEIKESFYPLREDPERFLIASCAARLCQEVSEPDSESSSLFSLLYYMLTFLAYSEAAPKDLLCGFLLHFLDCIGYRPSLTFCASCRKDVRGDARLFFSADAGGTLCEKCRVSEPQIEKLTLEAMRRILLLDNKDLDKIKMNPDLQGSILSVISSLLSSILEKNARGLEILDEIRFQ